MSLNKLKLRFLRERNNRAAARAEKILQTKQKFLSTILIGNSIVNIAISVVLTAAALRIFGDSGLGIAVAAGTVLLLIFGEILPKSIALVYPDALSLAFARFILLVMAILSPVVMLFSAVTGVLLRLCGIREVQNTAAVTEADLREFFQAREEGGFIGSDERTVLTNILRYGDFSVRSVMTPRRDITAIHIGASAEEIIELSKKSRFSRFPVYSTNIDAIQGFFYIKDFLFSPEYVNGSAGFQVSAYLRKPLFVFETTKLAQVEKKFHTEQQTMAIVLDEYGGTAGLITVEDVSEEIFGSILDEYDEREAAVPTGSTVPVSGTRQPDAFVQAGNVGEQGRGVPPLQSNQTGNLRSADADTSIYSVAAERTQSAAAGMAVAESVETQIGAAAVQMGQAVESVQPIQTTQPVQSKTTDKPNSLKVLPENESTAVPTANKSVQVSAAASKFSLAANKFGTLSAAVASNFASANVSSAAALKSTAAKVSTVPSMPSVQAGTDDAVTDNEAQGSFSIAGSTRLGDLNDRLNLNLESQYSDTIGGYIMEKAGEIPSAGYAITVDPYVFTVIKVEANRIAQIEVRMQAEA